jgi:hypothetical protein
LEKGRERFGGGKLEEIMIIEDHDHMQGRSHDLGFCKGFLFESKNKKKINAQKVFFRVLENFILSGDFPKSNHTHTQTWQNKTNVHA